MQSVVCVCLCVYVSCIVGGKSSRKSFKRRALLCPPRVLHCPWFFPSGLNLSTEASATSHYNALGAAASLGVVVANLHRLDRSCSVRHAAGVRVALHLAVVPADLPDDVIERLVDIDSRFRRRLDELAVE